MFKVCTLIVMFAVSGIVPVLALDLVQVYTLGVQNDPQLRASRLKCDSIRESHPLAQAQLLPVFSAGGSLKRTHLNVIGGGFSFGGEGDDLYNQTEFTLSLSQPLYSSQITRFPRQRRSMLHSSRICYADCPGLF